MRMILAIGCAGFLGAITRYLLSGWVHRALSLSFPAGTLLVNVTGSLILGAVFELSTTRAVLSPEMRTVIGVGFLGALTTFSSFSLETVTLLREGSLILSAANILSNVVLCIAAVWIGISIVRLAA